MEKILSINEGVFRVNPDGWEREYEGFEIVTDKQTIKVGITTGQSCCENFGYLITNDDTSEFLGAILKDVSLTDSTLNNKVIDDLQYLDCGGAMFVNLNTDKGVLQIVAYNAHNGYYGHEAVLISKQLNYSEGL